MISKESSSTTRGGRHDSSDSGGLCRCLQIFRPALHCIIELRISKDRWVVVARRDRRDKAETILWRQFRSGPVIVVEVERDLGSVFFALSYRR